jgi:predicted nucleotidyltransferase
MAALFPPVPPDEPASAVWKLLDRNFLADVVRRSARPVFATVSGAHLYGFASPDSDVDLRGAFLLDIREMLGLRTPVETITVSEKGRYDLDWVAHDVRKFARMLVSHNGYVLEQLYSPLVVVSTAAFEELRELGRGCVTRPTVRHYQGFARGRRQRLHEPGPTVKHLLYAYRVLLTGIHLMRTGEVEANVLRLAELLGEPEVPDLVERKRSGSEQMALGPGEVAHHDVRLDWLEESLAAAHASSRLPDEPTSRAAMEDFVIRLRMEPQGEAER